MRSGDLNERVEIWRMGERQRDEGGGWIPGEPARLATVWAKVSPISGRERVEARAVQATAMYRVTMRRRTDLTEADWLIWRGETMNIRFLPRVSGKTPFMTLDCEMGVDDGTP